MVIYKRYQQTVEEESMNARRKNYGFIYKKSQLSNFKEKKMALKLFEFQEQIRVDTSLSKLTQFQKTGAIGKDFFSGDKLEKKNTFKTRIRSRFS